MFSGFLRSHHHGAHTRIAGRGIAHRRIKRLADDAGLDVLGLYVTPLSHKCGEHTLVVAQPQLVDGLAAYLGVVTTTVVVAVIIATSGNGCAEAEHQSSHQP